MSGGGFGPDHTVPSTPCPFTETYSYFSFTLYRYNTHLLPHQLYQGTLLCNYVYHFSTASTGAACTVPGLRKLSLDPRKTILPNNKSQASAWYANVHMDCTTADDGQGCGCVVTSQVTNSLGGYAMSLNSQGQMSNTVPNGLDTGIGYSTTVTPHDSAVFYSGYPHKGVCYIPPVAPPRKGCSPTWNYTGLNG